MKCPYTQALAHLTPNCVHYFLILAAGLALGFAYTAEYGFGIRPCDFCLYERGIYAGVILAGIGGLKSRFLKGHRGILAQLTILSLGIGLTVYHVGMEQHWWAGPASCAAVSASDSFEAFRDQLTKALPPRCDQVTWALFGISATLWNLMLQAGLAFLASLGLYLPKTP